MFAWLKNRRRRQLLATPFPDNWLAYLDAVKYYHFLAEPDQDRLRDALRIFIAEKTWEGCKGLVLTEEMQVTVAAMACLLVLGMESFYFDNVQTVLLYPEGFVGKERQGLTDEFYLEQDTARIGEAHYRGPVILSWAEIQLDAQDPGHGTNLVIHEFAHQLDMLNGSADGVPLLPPELEERWQTIMSREYTRLERHARRETLIDPYGATDPAEFFAVVSESFFDTPLELKHTHARLYQLLSDYYRQDPASWKKKNDCTSH